MNLSTLLTTLRVLLSSPNPDDALMPEMAEVFKASPMEFERRAREATQQLIMKSSRSSSSNSSSSTPSSSISISTSSSNPDHPQLTTIHPTSPLSPTNEKRQLEEEKEIEEGSSEEGSSEESSSDNEEDAEPDMKRRRIILT